VEGVHYNHWRIIAALSGITFLVGASNLSIILALPTMVDDLQSSIFIVIWVVLIYALVSNALAILMGRIGDLYGRKLVLIIGLAIASFGLFLAYLAPDANTLILSRIIQGIGGSMTAGMTQAIAVEVVPQKIRGKAIGIVTSGWALGALGGPVIGGIILTVSSWRNIFLTLAIATVIVLIVIMIILPKMNKAKGEFRFDFIGASLFPASLASLLIAMTIGMDPRVGGAFQIPLYILSAILFVLFVMVEKKGKFPMIDFQLLRNREYSIAISLGGVYTLAHHGFPITMTFYLLTIRGFSNLETAGILMIIPLLSLLNPVGGWISDKVSHRIPILLGMGIIAVGYLGLSLRIPNLSFNELVFFVSLIGIGGFLSWSPTTSMALGAVRRDVLGVASSILFSMRAVGSQIGQAMVITILAFFVAGNLDTIFRMSGSPSVSDTSVALLGIQFVFAASVIVLVIGIGLVLLIRSKQPKLESREKEE